MIMQSVDTLEEEIAREKRALRENVDELQYRARNAVDWRTQVHRHPLAMVGIAAAGGLLLAMMFRPGRGTVRAITSLAGAVAPTAGRLLLAKRMFGRRKQDVPGLKRVVRNARRTAARAASSVADRLNVGDWEVPRARRPKHHSA